MNKTRYFPESVGTLFLFGVLIFAMIPTPVLGQSVDDQITVDAPTGGTQWWVDTDVAGNGATTVDTIQRCRRIEGETFEVDVVVYDVTGLGSFRLSFHFDGTYVEFVDADVDYLLTSAGGALQLVDVFQPDSNSVLVGALLEDPGPPASGSGILARLTFIVKAPEGQTGLDIHPGASDLRQIDGTPVEVRRRIFCEKRVESGRHVHEITTLIDYAARNARAGNDRHALAGVHRVRHVGELQSPRNHAVTRTLEGADRLVVAPADDHIRQLLEELTVIQVVGEKHLCHRLLPARRVLEPQKIVSQVFEGLTVLLRGHRPRGLPTLHVDPEERRELRAGEHEDVAGGPGLPRDDSVRHAFGQVLLAPHPQR